MPRGSYGLRLPFLAVLLGLGLANLLFQSCATMGPDILKMVPDAKTPADHEAIAEYYEKQAAENEAQATFHRRLGETYQRFHSSYKVNMVPHCEEAADNYAKIAAQDSALAEKHRKLAHQVK